MFSRSPKRGERRYHKCSKLVTPAFGSVLFKLLPVPTPVAGLSTVTPLGSQVLGTLQIVDATLVRRGE